MEEQLSSAMPLSALSIGCRGRVIQLIADGAIRRRLLDLGLIEGTEVMALQQSPSGDPIAYLIRGAVIALRSEDAAQILIRV